MIYSPELARFLAPYVSRLVGAWRRHALLPLKVAAVGAALAVIPVVALTVPAATPIVVQGTVAAAASTAVEVQQAAREVAPGAVARVEQAAAQVQKDVKQAVQDGALLAATPAAPQQARRGLTHALGDASKE